MDRIKIEINGEEQEVNVNSVDELEKLGIKMENKTFRGRKNGSLRGRIIGATPLIATVVFLLLGFLGDLWHPGWVVFLAIPIVPIILHLFDEGAKAAIVSITLLVSVIGYLVLGFGFNLWHPGWIIFFLIPIVSIFVGDQHKD